MLFGDDIVLIDKTRHELNDKLEQLKHTLESREFRLSRSKSEYLTCGFSGVEGGGGEVTISEVVIPRAEKFKHLDSTVEEKGDIDEDISYRMRVR